MVAVDLGAQSGRVALGSFDGERLRVTELHRFPNVPVRVVGTLHWDALRLFDETLAGLALAGSRAPTAASVAVDTWGVDYALLDRTGRLLQNPVHHRDDRTEGSMERVFAEIPARELYERTGIQMMPINSLFQLAAAAGSGDPVLEIADRLLLMPDLLHYWLSGVASSELTNATTSQCFDPRTEEWAGDVLRRVGIPERIFPEVVPPATVLGRLREEVAERTGLRRAVVVAGATHDTASAVAAVPFRHADAAYISCGTWSLVGLERPAPLIDDRTFAANLTNEGGVEGTFRVLKNVTGLWLLHECRRIWADAGTPWDFGQLLAMAEGAPPFGSYIDPNDPVFLSPGDMPARIRAFCLGTGQAEPADPGAVVRCILESLALKHRQTIELLSAATDIVPPEIHIVGGGARNELLCRWTADATRLPVLAGPDEATVIGNLVVQALALGELGSLGDAREVVRASFSPVLYEPRDSAAWDDAYAEFGRILVAAEPSGVAA
jgi:rhamnulokinase